MPSFTSYDGTRLSYRLTGDGPLLICVPGGPGRDSVYFGELGGLAAHRKLLILDNRGTGESDDASDVDSYRVDRMTQDIEALRTHLGLEKLDLMGHSAGAQLCTLYAVMHPERIGSLILLTGGALILGCDIEEAFEQALKLREGEPWFAEAMEAVREWEKAGFDVRPETKLKAAPFFYGNPWTEDKRAHAANDAAQRRVPEARTNFRFIPDKDEARAGAAKVAGPVLIYVGGVDPSPRPEEAEQMLPLFPHARLVVQPEAGHFPWLDDPEFFVSAISNFP